MSNSTPDSLSVLTIGNSFTDSLTACWPQVVASAGCQLHFERANHGGCELHRHWRYVEEEERDPACRHYQDPPRKLREILAARAWNVVTIQQASHASWDESTYQPFASRLAAYVHQHAPQAELVIQQTWSYRADDPRLQPGGWGFDQNGMYERLTAAYRRLARELGGLRVIPTGYAVQLARAHQPYSFVNYPPELLHTLRWPDLPAQAGSLVGTLFWRKDEHGSLKIDRDSIHLNLRGQYLQACVWFAFLYRRPTSDITFVPDLIDDRDAEFLRRMAQQAVDEFRP